MLQVNELLLLRLKLVPPQLEGLGQVLEIPKVAEDVD